jgi:kynurenine formamidase
MCLPGTVETVRERIETEGHPRIDRRAALLGAAGAALAAALPVTARASSGSARNVQDLTHLFFAGFPTFNPPSPVREDFTTFERDGYYSQKWTFHEHSGTHMDAPGHFFNGGRQTPDIPVSDLIAPLAVIDIRRKAARNPDAMVEVSDIRRYERANGAIPSGALVAMDSGWAAKVGNPLAFKGGASFPNYHFPGFSGDAALWLAENRDVVGIGVDTLSLDPGNSTTFDVHVNFLATNRYGVENLANLGSVPPAGATVYVGVIPWEEGSGGPLRAVATW